MAWWGKLLGGAFGFMFAGPLGAVLGIAFGHSLDVGVEKDSKHTSQNFSQADDEIKSHFGAHERIQLAFFTTTFSVMGYLAKSDGSVTKSEIDMAESLMSKMDLNLSLRKAAIKLFNAGKDKAFDLDGVLKEFIRECRFRRDLLQMFIEILFQAGYSDGQLTSIEKNILLHVCNQLGFSEVDFVRFDAMHRAGFYQDKNKRSNKSSGAKYSSTNMTLFDAYDILSVNENSSQSEVKKSYRKLMSQHHPDKLVSKGLPDEMMKMATEKAQEIKAAYETVCKHKGWK